MIQLLLALAAEASAPPAHPADTVIVLRDSPTVVAFLGADMGEIMYSSDWAQILAGFKPQLDSARPRLEQLSVIVREVYSPTILFRSRGQEWPMEPSPASLLSGYYLWAPEGPRYVCRGAMTAEDLVSTVTKYLALVKAQSADDLTGCERSEA